MASIHTHQLVAEPSALLALLVVRRREQTLTRPWSESETRALALRISDVFGDGFFRPDVILAMFGQPYVPEQLVQDRLLSRFAQRALHIIKSDIPWPRCPSVLPVDPGSLSSFLPMPHASRRDPTEPPTASGFTRVIGFPCAWIGSPTTLARVQASQSPQEVSCPALATCVAGPLQVHPGQVLLITLQRPTDIASTVIHWLGRLRRAEDLADATTHAQTLHVPVHATAACYGTAGRMAYLTLTIQDAATCQVLRTYRYRASHFPGGGAEADAFFQDLCFAWGAIDYLLVPSLQPVQLDATGALIGHRLRSAHRTAASISPTAMHSH